MCEKLYERYDANYCLALVIYCLDTTLLVCLSYIFNILSCNMVSILTTEDPAALRSRAIRRLVRFVTITIIVRERESEREFHFFVCVSQGSAFFNSAACPGPSRSRRPKCLHFSLRTMLELKLKDQFVELVPLAIPGDPGPRAPR